MNCSTRIHEAADRTRLLPSLQDSQRKDVKTSSTKIRKVGRDVKDGKVEERKQCDSFWARAHTVATHYLPCRRMQEVHKAAPLKSKQIWQHQFSHARPQPSRRKNQVVGLDNVTCIHKAVDI